ncbi:MAG: hypothetical protein ABW169_02695 [Sphingobium sp.]
MHAVMLGPRLTSVFRSRWTALLWARLVIWTAVDFVGVAPSHEQGDEAGSNAASPANAGDAAAIQQLLNDPK